MRGSKLWGIVGKIRSLFSKIRIMLLFSYFIIILICIAILGSISFYISYRSSVGEGGVVKHPNRATN